MTAPLQPVAANAPIAPKGRPVPLNQPEPVLFGDPSGAQAPGGAVAQPAPPQGGDSTPPAPGAGFTPVQPSAPGANIAAIRPGVNDLRGTSITPGVSDRLASVAGQADTARNAYAGAAPFTAFQPVTAGAGANNVTPFQGVGPGTTGGRGGDLFKQGVDALGQVGSGVPGASFGADTSEARAATMRSLGALETAPNRGQIASGQFDLLREAGQPGFEDDLRRVGQRASALGRVGAGMTTSDLGDVSQRRNEALSRDARGLSLDAASREMEDRLARVSAGQGVSSTFGNLDLGASSINQAGARDTAQLGLARSRALSDFSDSAFNRERGFRDEARDERGTRRGFETEDFNRGASLRSEARGERGTQRNFEIGDEDRLRGRAGDLTDLEGVQRGRESADRGELRGERGYQDEREAEATRRAVNQRMMEDDLVDRQFGRDQEQTRGLYGQGFGQDPTGTLTGQAGDARGEARDDFAGAGSALAEAMASRQRGMSPAGAGNVIGNSTPQVTGGQYQPRPIAPVQPRRTPVGGADPSLTQVF